jgi:phage baseplate assembly protein W
MPFNYTKLDPAFVTADNSGSYTFNNSIGILLPFNSPSGDVFSKSYFSLDQAKSNLINLLSSKKGERLYHIDFGTDLYQILFEPISDTSEIETEIRSAIVSAINTWTPYFTVNSVKVRYPTQNANAIESHMIKVELSVTFDPTQSNINVVIFINNQGSLTIE